MRRRPTHFTAAFTLLEVMIAIAFIGIALIALLALHHSDMQSVIRAQELTRAAMLGQALMSEAELERFPNPGQTHGDFSQTHPGEYPNFRWVREVTPSPLFPDITRVQVQVLYGPGFRKSFNLTEFMHNPMPPTPNQTNPGGGPSGPNGPGGVTLGTG
ncbi:MAG TPA: hypothetical protein VKS22_11460 [Candidatus Binataceae bacterium]|nr:hypothetical protein [Candidatus Binataceae bacterium]